MNFKRCIICGSGNSVSEGIDKGFLPLLKGEYTIGLNNWYKFGSEPTFISWVDWQWFMNNYQNIYDKPLLIGKMYPRLMKEFNDLLLKKYKDKYPTICPEIARHGINSKQSIAAYKKLDICPENAYFVRPSGTYQPNPIKNGAYSGHFCGMFALSIAIGLGFKEIYLLGYDGTAINGKTHFFQDKVDLDKEGYGGDTVYRGVGMRQLDGRKVYNTSTYNNSIEVNNYYKPFEQALKDVNIYNVSILSVIDIFPKLKYDQFIDIISDNYAISQNIARYKTKEKLLDNLP